MTRARLTVILVAILVSCALFAPGARAAEARFPKGAWSVGAQGGWAFFSMGDVNDILRIQNQLTGSRFDDLHKGWEATGDVRYAVNDKFFLGAESGVMQGRTRDPNSSDEIRVRGTSAVLQGGATVDASGAVAVRVLAGLGALLGARLENQDGFGVDDTAFLGYAGLEVEFRVTENIGLTGQGLARTCRLSQPDGVPYDLDFSGGSVRAGLCATFGGAP